jgi:enterochelin esterase-like enzyme
MSRVPTPIAVTLAVIFVIAATAVAEAALRTGAAQYPSGPPSMRIAEFHSKSVRGTVHLVVLLPAGYGQGRRRYPVVYFLHGLPASSNAYRDVGFLRRALATVSRPAILVAPQGARDHDTDPEYLDWGPGRNWETAVSRELPAYVDSHFRTIRSRRARALVGLSAGGYGAVALALHHLESFGVVESWSGYFHPTDPAGVSALDLGSDRRNQRANLHNAVLGLRRSVRARPTFFGFYVGREDARFRDENVELHRELAAAGVPHVFKVYPGAHERRVWSRHARGCLELALEHMKPATGSADPPPAATIPGFVAVARGPAGGVVLRGRIPNSVVPSDRRASAVYLPPGFHPHGTYRVLFLLHGFPGSPAGFYDSLQLAKIADHLIETGRIASFIAVMPIAGRTTGRRSDEEWAGRWEDYFVRDVVPWADSHLPLSQKQADRGIAGISAGGFGAVDIALRHPGMFGVVEAWSGYFHPFRDGPLAHASTAVLAAHHPTALARREAPVLRREHVRFFLSTGFNHGGIFRSSTFEFARELRALGVPCTVWASSRPDRGRYFRLQVPAALAAAVG